MTVGELIALLRDIPLTRDIFVAVDLGDENDSVNTEIHSVCVTDSGDVAVFTHLVGD